jgi:hypothetical protein
MIELGLEEMVILCQAFKSRDKGHLAFASVAIYPSLKH